MDLNENPEITPPRLPNPKQRYSRFVKYEEITPLTDMHGNTNSALSRTTNIVAVPSDTHRDIGINATNHVGSQKKNGNGTH